MASISASDRRSARLRPRKPGLGAPGTAAADGALPRPRAVRGRSRGPRRAAGGGIQDRDPFQRLAGDAAGAGQAVRARGEMFDAVLSAPTRRFVRSRPTLGLSSQGRIRSLCRPARLRSSRPMPGRARASDFGMRVVWQPLRAAPRTASGQARLRDQDARGAAGGRGGGDARADAPISRIAKLVFHRACEGPRVLKQIAFGSKPCPSLRAKRSNPGAFECPSSPWDCFVAALLAMTIPSGRDGR